VADDLITAIQKLEKLVAELPQRLHYTAQLALERASLDGISKLSELFKTEGRSLGVSWASLKEKTLKAKLKKGYSEKILHRTTTLAQSFSYEVSDLQAVIGTPVKYAIYHEYGAPRRNIPARPFMEPVANYLYERGLKKALDSAFKEVFG